MKIDELLKNFDFDEKTTIKIKKLSQNKDNHIKENLKYFENINYSKSEIVQMLTKYYNIINYDTTFIEEKINYFKSLKLKNEEIKKIIISKPTILAYDLSTLKSKIEIFQKYCFKEDEINQIIIKMPSILSFSYENLNKKLKILNSLNIKDIILHNPKLVFIQSETLTLARYKYLKEINFEFNQTSIRYLFSDNKKFTTKFKITKEELLKKYQ